MLTKRLMAFSAVAALVFAACSSSTATPTTGVLQATSSPSSATSAPSSAAAIDGIVFGTNYKPQPGKAGGTIIMGEWQAAYQLNPYYTNAEADLEAIMPMMRSFATVSSDGKYIPDLAAEIPTTTNGGITVSGSTMAWPPSQARADGPTAVVDHERLQVRLAVGLDKAQFGLYYGTWNGFPDQRDRCLLESASRRRSTSAPSSAVARVAGSLVPAAAAYMTRSRHRRRQDVLSGRRGRGERPGIGSVQGLEHRFGSLR